jgi:hypothetical protein
MPQLLDASREHLSQCGSVAPLGSKPRGFDFVYWKSSRIPVIAAEAGIQAVFAVEPKTNPHTGARRYDELSLTLTARAFNHPREKH